MFRKRVRNQEQMKLSDTKRTCESQLQYKAIYNILQYFRSSYASLKALKSELLFQET